MRGGVTVVNTAANVNSSASRVNITKLSDLVHVAVAICKPYTAHVQSRDQVSAVSRL
jgi:hypothetical protein